MAETQDTISDWADATFGQAPSVARIAARANEEMAELLRHATSGHADPDKIMEEVADVVIVLYRIGRICNMDLHTCIDLKMQINRERKWALDGTGHGYHVRNR